MSFERVRPYLEAHTADVLCLQEVPDARQTLKSFGPLGQYQLFVPPHNQRRSAPYNTNAVLSRFPIVGSGVLTFGDLRPGLYGLEELPWVDLDVSTLGTRSARLRVYDCHLGIGGLGLRTRIAQLRRILAHAASVAGPVIICGDMNTTTPSVGWRRSLVNWYLEVPASENIIDGALFRGIERELFAQVASRAGFTDALDINATTWAEPRTKFEIFHHKLDWFLGRGVTTHATLGPYISDHRPIRATCEKFDLAISV